MGAHDEDALLHAVATNGPVSVAFQVTGLFRFYKKGIYNSWFCRSDAKHVNHAVLVGYGVEECNIENEEKNCKPKPYWIVKNSWGSQWGDNGYFRIARGKNMCGIAVCASYPIV